MIDSSCSHQLEADGKCSDYLYCTNCGGNHSALDRYNCKEYSNIIKIRNKQAIDALKAPPKISPFKPAYQGGKTLTTVTANVNNTMKSDNSSVETLRAGKNSAKYNFTVKKANTNLISSNPLNKDIIEITPEFLAMVNPSTSGTHPATSGAQPATSGAQPATFYAHPTSSSAQPTLSCVQPALFNSQSALTNISNATEVAENNSMTTLMKFMSSQFEQFKSSNKSESEKIALSTAELNSKLDNLSNNLDTKIQSIVTSSLESHTKTLTELVDDKLSANEVNIIKFIESTYKLVKKAKIKGGDKELEDPSLNSNSNSTANLSISYQAPQAPIFNGAIFPNQQMNFNPNNNPNYGTHSSYTNNNMLLTNQQIHGHYQSDNVSNHYSTNAASSGYQN